LVALTQRKIASMVNKEEIYLLLAALFFSGETASEKRFEEVAAVLKSAGWDRDRTEKVLLQLIAPHAKRNLGYGLPTVMGEWDLLDTDNLLPHVLRSEELREKYQSPYLFLIPDWLNKRLLRKLKIERLLNLL
jgi:hypothetical protein